MLMPRTSRERRWQNNSLANIVGVRIGVHGILQTLVQLCSLVGIVVPEVIEAGALHSGIIVNRELLEEPTAAQNGEAVDFGVTCHKSVGWGGE
jgi:hypothetical protein